MVKYTMKSMLSLKIIMARCVVKSKPTGVATSSVNNKLFSVKRGGNISKTYMWWNLIFCTVLCSQLATLLKLQFNSVTFKRFFLYSKFFNFL